MSIKLIVRCLVFGLLLCSSKMTSAQNQEKIDSLEAIFDVLTDHVSKVDVLNQLSWAALANSSDEAERYANRALTIARNVDYKKGIAMSLNTLGSISKAEERYDQALTYYEEALRIEEERKNWSAIGISYNYMGQVHLAQEKYEEALDAYNRAIELGGVTNDPRSIMLAHASIGELYARQDSLQKALESYQLAIDLLGNKPVTDEMAIQLKIMANLLLEIGDEQQAKIRYLQALRRFTQDKNWYHSAEVNFELGNIALRDDNTAQAIVYYQRSLDQAQSVKHTQYIISGYEMLSEAHYQANDIENALRYQRLYSAAQNSSSEKDFQTNLDAMRLETDLLAAEKDRKLAESQLRNSRTITIALTSGVVLMAIFLFFMIRQYKVKNDAIKALKTAKEESERSQLEKEKFLAYTSHEIRTPLNGVVGMIQLLRKTTLSSQQKKYVDTIKSSSDNILVIVNDILDMSRIDSGKIDFEAVDFMLTELIEEIVYMMRPKALAKGIELRAEIDKELPAVIKGDPLRMNQILLNLVNNALKFTEEGEVVVSAHVLQQGVNSVKVGLSVTDTGIGIKKEKLSSVFNRFEQEDRHTTRKYGGAGLGLNITKQLVELQGGSISVRSKYKEGATFSVRIEFPIGESSGEVVKRVLESNEAVVPPEEVGALKLLLVDDNSLNLEILIDLLKAWNPHVKLGLANDGKAAIQELQEQDYDLVLMDIQMPRMNGYAATHHIRYKMPAPKNGVPVIAMTAHALHKIEEEMLEAGMNDYVSKPIDLNDLTVKISKLVNSKRPVKIPQDDRYSTINLDNLRDLTRNDNTKIVKYIDIFLKNVPKDLELLKQHLHNEDWEGLGKAAHKMKGNSSYMGIRELNDLFVAAQNYDDDEMEPEEVESMVRRIDEVCSMAVKELHQVREELLTTG